MKTLIGLLALLPALALAIPAQVTVEWTDVEHAETYTLWCGFDPAELDEVATSATTSATTEITLPSDQGTLYCAVDAVSAGGQVSDLSLALSATWDVTDVRPEPPEIITIQIICPEGYQCDVSVSQP